MPEYRRNSADGIDAYMANICKISRIDRAEEERLSRIMKDAAQPPETRKAARDTLICANLRLVVKIAHDFRNCGLGLADLVAEGNQGLMIATDKFDPDNGAKFSVYAGWWIKQCIRRAIQWQARRVRIPSGTLQRYLNIRKAASRYLAEHGEAPDNETLATLTGYPLCTITALDKAITDTVSMDETLSEDSDTTFSAMLDTQEDDSDRRAAVRSLVHRSLACLTQLEQEIVSGLFGLSGPALDSVTLAKETGLSPADVEARLQGALSKLRTEISSDRHGQAIPAF